MEVFLDALSGAVLITGLVIIMMMMLEYINVSSSGRMGTFLGRSRFGQVLLGGLLGAFPGCIGGFACVSLYSHGMISFGALTAMMIASSGDEAFVMLAMFPGKALLIFAALLVVAIAVGALVDAISPRQQAHAAGCDAHFEVHGGDRHGIEASWSNLRHPSLQRIVLLLAIALFIVALAFGMLEHEEHETAGGGFNIFNEYWLNLFFAVCSLFALWFVAVGSEHFVQEHLWEHVVGKHCLRIFLWSFAALLLIGIAMHHFDLERIVSGNIPLMILLAVLVGLIPESGPHLVFVTLFAGGLIPASVMIASCISQDGHASLPLLAEDKGAFVKAKLINAAVAAVVGYALYFAGI